jgi:hypothetical protein
MGTALSIKLPTNIDNFSTNNITIDEDNNIGIQTRINLNYYSTLSLLYQY